MVKRKRFWLLLILWGGGLLSIAPAGWAGPKEDLIRRGEQQLEGVRRRRDQIRQGIPKLQEQIKGAEEVRQKMESVLPGMKAEAEAAREALDEAEQRVRDARKAGVEVRAQLEESQGENSELNRTKRAYESARQELQEEIEFVESLLEDKESYRRALAADDRKAAALIRKDALDADGDVVAAREDLRKAKSAYDAAREALFASNPEYAVAVNEYEGAKASEKEIEERAKPVMSRIRVAQKQYKRHLKDIAKARRMLAGGEAELRSLELLEQRIARQLEEVRRRPR